MNILVAVLALAAIVSPALADIDYCDPSYCADVDLKHAACDHNGTFASTCSDAVLVDIDDNLKNVILAEINQKRDYLAYGNGACRMGIMQWDDELAKFAALNVMGCNLEDNDCPESKTYMDWSQEKNAFEIEGEDDQVEYIQEAFADWFKMEPETHDQDYSRFLDMWFQDNYNVGCGAAMYTESGVRKYLITCNFGTKVSDNLDYSFNCEQPAIGCQTGASADYPNLCSEDEVYEYL